MRAEAQAHVDTINDALSLLRRFLNWDTALRRLDELNARVEDQSLWDDPKAAQEVMRERRRLDEAITATRAIEEERDSTVELIELADAEGDAALADEGAAALGKSASNRRQAATSRAGRNSGARWASALRKRAAKRGSRSSRRSRRASAAVSPTGK